MSQKPDFGEWKQLTEEQLLEAMGGGKYKGRDKLIQQLRRLAGSFAPVSPAMALLIQSSAQQRNFVLYSPDSHLTGYHRNLVKRGMSAMEANKRAARALVGVIYRTLSALVADNPATPAANQKKEGEGDMASGLTRGDQSHTSNISPSSLRNSKGRVTKSVKRLSARTVNAGTRRKAVSKKPLDISKTISNDLLKLSNNQIELYINPIFACIEAFCYMYIDV